MIVKNFWQKREQTILLNPRLPGEEVNLITRVIEESDCGPAIWLRSSGTESYRRGIKMVCLEHESFLHAAHSFNDFYQVHQQDIWLNPLPQFHVGGLSIGARCFVAKATEVFCPSWNPHDFFALLEESQATCTSLVPAQVYDLVQSGIKASKDIRLVLVGGGALHGKLYRQAKELGWPVVPSYGMTETAAIIAGAELKSLNCSQFPKLQLLPHVNLQKNSQGQFEVRAECLFQGYMWIQQGGAVSWERRPEPFVIDDKLERDSSGLSVVGRESELIKVNGETVNLMELSLKIASLLEAQVFVSPQKEDRRGYRLFLFYEKTLQEHSIEKLNKQLMPYERLFKMVPLEALPRTPLGKIDVAKINQFMAKM